MHALTRDRVRLLRAIECAIPAASRTPKDCYDYIQDSPKCIVWNCALMRVWNDMRADGHGHYVSYSQDNPKRISYARSVDYKYDSMRRTKVALGRYMRRNYGTALQAVPDSVIDAVVREVMGSLEDAGEYITLVSGDELSAAYAESYGDESCMTGEKAYLVGLYAANPDRVQLIKYSNGINARALLWLTDSGQHVMDRVYPNSGYHVEALQTWAKARGHAYRTRQSAGVLDVTGFKDDACITITLKYTTGDWPYADTFMYGADLECGGVRLSNTLLGGFGDFELSCTDGRRSDDDDTDTFECCNCGGRTDDPHLDGVDTYCYDCYYENFSSCEECGDMCCSNDLSYHGHTSVWLCPRCSCKAEEREAEEREAEREAEEREAEREREESEVTPSVE